MPQRDEEAFAFIDNPARRTYHAMAAHMDGRVGEMVALLRRKGMFDDALIVFSAGAAAQRSSLASRRLC